MTRRCTQTPSQSHAAEEGLFDAQIDAPALEADDFFTFEIERTGTLPERLGGSHRFRATAHLAGRQFETLRLLRWPPLVGAAYARPGTGAEVP